MSDTNFAYTHRLSDEGFASSWVSDVYYAERAKELLLHTLEDKWYLYNNVPPQSYNALVGVARGGGSVGSAVDILKRTFGPGRHLDTAIATPCRVVEVPDSAVLTTQAPVNYPQAVRTEVHYRLDGRAVKPMVSNKPADEALNDYMSAVSNLGLNAELRQLVVVFDES